MLNISLNRINEYIDRSKYSALSSVEDKSSGTTLIRVLTVFFLLMFLLLFLPWTQNIITRGNVTALQPEHRPQTIHSIISGRVEQWFVQEGDFVEKGDTILFISEIKEQYSDPQLLERTNEQLSSKQQSVETYRNKVGALEKQIRALDQTGKLKLRQAENKLKQSLLKVASDSMDLEAARVNFQIAQKQFERFESLFDKGLKSKTDLENRSLSLQKARAALIAQENKLLTSRNEAINAEFEITKVEAEYQDAIAKAESDKFAALSSMYDTDAVVSKLKNEYANYTFRSGLYYVTAPQDGYITKAIQTGIGETLKEGTPIISIMPSKYELAVEMYIKPIDLPLLQRGQNVRIQFDGWPAIVFSGWPNTSYGTYGGEIVAIDNIISPNGMYRILVANDPSEVHWPKALRIGAGTRNIVLLNDVPIWYELWRKINGFPPDYYVNIQNNSTGEKNHKLDFTKNEF